MFFANYVNEWAGFFRIVDAWSTTLRLWPLWLVAVGTNLKNTTKLWNFSHNATISKLKVSAGTVPLGLKVVRSAWKGAKLVQNYAFTSIGISKLRDFNQKISALELYSIGIFPSSNFYRRVRLSLLHETSDYFRSFKLSENWLLGSKNLLVFKESIPPTLIICSSIHLFRSSLILLYSQTVGPEKSTGSAHFLVVGKQSYRQKWTSQDPDLNPRATRSCKFENLGALSSFRGKTLKKVKFRLFFWASVAFIEKMFPFDGSTVWLLKTI